MRNDEKIYDASGNLTAQTTRGSRAGDSSLGSAAAVQDRMKGLGAAASSRNVGMPKQNPGESASDYAARVRKWREAKEQDPALAGQRRALKGMGQ